MASVGRACARPAEVPDPLKNIWKTPPDPDDPRYKNRADHFNAASAKIIDRCEQQDPTLAATICKPFAKFFVISLKEGCRSMLNVDVQQLMNGTKR
jgi:hypothetical protein